MTALVAGGAGAALAKSGLLAKMWKFWSSVRWRCLRASRRSSDSGRSRQKTPRPPHPDVDLPSLLPLILVVWCVYVSDAVWWTTSNSLMLTGVRIGEFRAQHGPSLPLREGTGFFAPRLFPPFRYAFQFDIDAPPDAGRIPAKRAGVERLVTQVLSQAAPLRRLGEGLWIYLFVVVPLAIGSLGLARTWAPLLALLAIFLTAIVVTYRRGWRALHASHASGWRSDAALMVVSPLGAIRAADRLTRKALHEVSGMRVLSVIAPRHEFCRVARLVYFDEATPRQLDAKRELDEILESEGLRAALVAPPARDSGMLGFCRRCHAQVMRDGGDCPDCVVVPITPFDGQAT